MYVDVNSKILTLDLTLYYHQKQMIEMFRHYGYREAIEEKVLLHDFISFKVLINNNILIFTMKLKKSMKQIIFKALINKNMLIFTTKLKKKQLIKQIRRSLFAKQANVF